MGVLRQEKFLIVCDRGSMDNKAYMMEEEFDSVLAKFGVDKIHIRDNYDAVFHFVMVAKGAE